MPLRRKLKLLVILSAYLQSDAGLARLRTARRIADELSTAEIDELTGDCLICAPSALSRLARTAIGRGREAWPDAGHSRTC